MNKANTKGYVVGEVVIIRGDHHIGGHRPGTECTIVHIPNGEPYDTAQDKFFRLLIVGGEPNSHTRSGWQYHTQHCFTVINRNKQPPLFVEVNDEV